MSLVARRHQLVELVAGAYLGGHFERHVRAFLHMIHRLEVDARVVELQEEGARGRAGDEQVVARAEVGGLDEEFGHAELGEILDAAADVDFLLRGFRTVVAAPFAEALAEVVAVPEAAVEHGLQAFVPGGHAFGGEGAVEAGLDGLLVTFGHDADVFGPAGASFDLEHAHAGVDHLVHEVDGLEVFGRHDVFVVHLQLDVAVAVAHGVGAAAHLHAGAAVGRGAEFVEAQVAFAGDGHAEGAVAEHLDAHQLSAGAADVFVDDVAVDFLHLFQVELACQDDDVGEAGVEAQGLDIGDVELRGEVDFLSDAVAVVHDGDVGGDDGRDARLACGVADVAHEGDVFVVDDGVDGEVALHAVRVAGGGYLAQVVDGERAGRAGTHVEVLDAEVDGVCPGLYGGGQRFARADGGHDFKVVYGVAHDVCLKMVSGVQR